MSTGRHDAERRLCALAAARARHAGALDEPATARAAATAHEDLDAALLAWSAALPEAPRFESAIRAVGRAGTLAVLVLAVLALVAGGGAARAALGGGDRPTNVYAALATIAGPPLVALAIWCAGLLLPGVARHAALVAGAARAIALRLARHAPAPPLLRTAAIHAWTEALGDARVGRRTLDAVVHGVWTAWSLGAIAVLAAILATRDYRFGWETTILSGDAYAWITRMLGAGPRAFGFPVPDAATVVATRLPAESGALDAANRAWSGFLLGASILYALGPRLVLLGWALGARRGALRAWRPRSEGPVLTAWRGALREAAHAEATETDEGPDPHPTAVHPPPTTVRAAPAIARCELDDPAGGWPPGVHGVRWLDLGRIDGRTDRARAIVTLHEAGGVRDVVLVVPVARVPDRGVAALLASLQSEAGGAAHLVLSGGQAQRERDATRLERRLEQWHAFAAASAPPGTRVVEVDLDHLTDASRAQLAAGVALPETRGTAPAPDRTGVAALSIALDRIATHFRRDDALDPAAQAALHGAIAQCFDDGARRALLPALDLRAATRSLRDALVPASRGVLERLPAVLRAEARWAVAGATAGALACAGLALAAAPAAVLALPAWSGLGAAIFAAGRLAFGGAAGAADVEPVAPLAAPDDEDDGWDRAVDAAVLLAVLLAAQGCGEAAVSRILGRTLAGDDAPLPAGDHAALDRRLAAVRTRFAAALADEGDDA